jgi:hypothetical protein
MTLCQPSMPNSVAHPLASIPTLPKDEHFFFQGVEDKALSEFLKALQDKGVDRQNQSPLHLKSSLLQDVQQVLPHWTPTCSDTIAYATVDIAESAKVEEVAAYLQKLKQDLHIGEEGFPEQVVVAGDQQTYALMKNLKIKYPRTFSWLIAMPGDWHLLKCAAETLRDMLWEGGLQHCAKSCKYMKEVNQWKDLHSILTALHEALIHEAIADMCAQNILLNLDDWVAHRMSEENMDDVSRFWAQSLYFLNGYVGYFTAIRSGNFQLRNGCIVILTKLFSAYSHNKYEQLACQTIHDVLTLPTWIKDKFENGEWTVSQSARAFHNTALDECHEMVINRRMKDLTSRPSEYRTVSLANFMAYLDKFMQLFTATLYKFSRKRKKNKAGNTVYEFSEVILKEVQKCQIFSCKTNRELINIFSSKPRILDNETKSDLLSVNKEGEKRMRTYIRQHIIIPPLEQPQKIRNRKLKTFSTKKKSQRTQQSQITQMGLLLKRAYSQLQRDKQYQPNSVEYPLALCTEFGEMRGRQKSSIKEAMTSITELQSMFSATLPFSLLQAEVIIDFLRYLHCPPPPDVETYGQLFNYFWDDLIIQQGFRCKGVNVVTLVIDKPRYMPNFRSLIHSERKEKSKAGDEFVITKLSVESDDAIYKGSLFGQALQHEQYKANIIQFLTGRFIEKAKELPPSCAFIIDSPSLGHTPIMVTEATDIPAVSRTNYKGEADLAVWFHASRSYASQVLVLANDTDIWMGGMALMEGGWLGQNTLRNIAVELSYNKEYVNLNEAVRGVQSLSTFCHLAEKRVACATVLACYILSGSDYVSGFYQLTHAKILKTMIKYAPFISPVDDMLVKSYDINENMVFDSLSTHAVKRLLCCVYLDRHNGIYKHLHSTPTALLTAFNVVGNKMNADMKN